MTLAILSLLASPAQAFDPAPWDACADGDGGACWELSQSLPLEEGALSPRAERLRLEGCTLGHDPACAELIQGLPERPRRDDTEPLVQACVAGAQETCAWLQRAVPADLAVMQANKHCASQDCEVDPADFLPPGWSLVHERSRRYGQPPMGQWSSGSAGLSRSGESIWLSDRLWSPSEGPWRSFTTAGEPGLWNLETGEVTAPPAWCPEPLLCTPDSPQPTDLDWLERTLQELPEGYRPTLVGDALWISRPEYIDYRSGEVERSADLRILRPDTPDQVLEHQGYVQVLTPDLILVQSNGESHLLRADGEHVATVPALGDAALSPDGSTLLIGEVFVDLSSLEPTADTATRCAYVSWGEGGAYCSTDFGLLFHPHPAGAPREMTPPRGWEAYGRVEITVPELLPGQHMELRSKGHSADLGPSGSTYTLWVGDHVDTLEIWLISEDTLPEIPLGQSTAVPAPRPGESLSLSPQVRALPLTLPGCEGAVQTAASSKAMHFDWSALQRDCAVEIPGLLVGAELSIQAREIPLARRWRATSSVPQAGDLTLEPIDKARDAGALDFQGEPQLSGREHLTWTDGDGVSIKVARERARVLASGGRSGLVVLRQGDTVETQTLQGDFTTLSLGPGTWEGAVLSRSGSLPLRVDNDSPLVIGLSADPDPAQSVVRVLAEDGLPIARARVHVAVDGQEPTWGALPRFTHTLTLETDLAGRVEVPDPGWPIWVWGQGWMQRIERGEHQTVQNGPAIPEQRGINARLEATPYGLQVVSSVCVEEHWLEKGDTLVELCGQPLAGRSERAVELLLMSSPAQECEARALTEGGVEKVGLLSAHTTSPFSLPDQLPAERPRLETPEYEAWKAEMLPLAPVERCGPPLGSELERSGLAIQVLEAGDPELLVQDAAAAELDFVVWYPNGTPAAVQLSGQTWPLVWPHSVPATQLRRGGPKVPRSVLMAVKQQGAGARLRVWSPMSSGRAWLVADVHVRVLSVE